MSMIVYRIEHRENRHGPWGQGRSFSAQIGDDDRIGPSAMPCLWAEADAMCANDELRAFQDRCPDGSERFAYPSYATLRRWWSERYLALIEASDFVIAEYAIEAEDIASAFILPNQVLYDVRKARRLSEFRPTEKPEWLS